MGTSDQLRCERARQFVRLRTGTFTAAGWRLVALTVGIASCATPPIDEPPIDESKSGVAEGELNGRCGDSSGDTYFAVGGTIERDRRVLWGNIYHQQISKSATSQTLDQHFGIFIPTNVTQS